MPTVLQATHPISRPGNDMRYAGRHLLLTARAPEGLVRAGPADPADEPLTIAVGLTARGPSDGTVQIELGALWTSAMSSGHGSSVGGMGPLTRNDAAVTVEPTPTGVSLEYPRR